MSGKCEECRIQDDLDNYQCPCEACVREREGELLPALEYCCPACDAGDDENCHVEILAREQEAEEVYEKKSALGYFTPCL